MNWHRHTYVLIAFLVGIAAQAAEPIRLANRPALSADGKTLAFDWNGDIWSVPSQGGVAKPLTANPAKDISPKFSPDGSKLAFVSDRTGSNQVFVMPASGGTPRQLTHNSAGYTLLEWTPDGNGLLLESVRDTGYGRHSNSRFYIVPYSEDPAKQLAEQLVFDDYGTAGTLSADGRTILFNREGTEWWRKGYKGSEGAQIWGYDRQTKKFDPILSDGFNNFWPLWKPDGKGCYYVGGADKTFNLFEFTNGRARQITKYTDDGVAFPCISRDGATIVYRQLFDFYRLEPGKNETPVKIEILRDDDRPTDKIDRHTLTSASQASFTADGLEMAFIAGGDVWVMDTELREPKRITKTAEEERSVCFAPDGKSILFISDMGGTSDIYRALRSDDKKPWMLNENFKIEKVTTYGDVSNSITFSPDGAKMAFLRNKGNLWIADADGKNATEFMKSWNAPQFDWSPDGKWLVYAVDDDDFNSDIWIAPLDKSKPSFNLSRHPYNDRDPVWSPDGKVIAWVGARDKKDEYDIHFVYLSKEDDEKSGREKSIEKAIDKLQKGRSSLAPFIKKVTEDVQQPEPAPTPRSAVQETPKAEPKPIVPSKKPLSIAIDFDGIHDRVRRVVSPGINENALFFSPDSRKLAFTAGSGISTIDIPDGLRAGSISSTPTTGAKWLRNLTIVGLSNGVPTLLTPPPTWSTSVPSNLGGAPSAPAIPTGPARRGGGGAVAGTSATTSTTGIDFRATTLSFTAYQDVDIAKKHQAAFDMAWRVMRDNWYDGRLGTRDWNAVRAKYLAMADTPDLDTLQTCVQMMLGELNGSHLGFMTGAAALPVRGALSPEQGWRETTAHLGARFDPNFPGPGWKVRDTLPGTPADQKKTKLLPGDIVLAIDGKTIDNAIDPAAYLNGNPNRDIALKVKNSAGEMRDITLRPISLTMAKALVYDKWLKDNESAVEKLSGSKLGYLHVKAMDDSSFHKFEESLFNAGVGKEGLLIDVRENGGGSTADHLLTALTQPRHAIAVPRDGGPGYPQDRTVYATWNKPIVVLCNQNSFSNAEIFSHAIKTLNRGHLVGVPTAGGVVSTGATRIMDIGVLRLPFRGWFKVDDGEDQELNGAVPHYVVWPQPGDMPKGKDDQLSKGVEVLLKDVQDEKAKPKPGLRKSSERR